MTRYYIDNSVIAKYPELIFEGIVVRDVSVSSKLQFVTSKKNIYLMNSEKLLM